ncbi:hypothetical protein DMH04_18725 [Kibdelosporangium aridum]|uniref:Uncharacterized protein n=1 Tax=Kibdelosporangium aridum TaxID=2030 RepID=A0A428ZA19_KIBAR|nr:hypothetical protein DMH04_18725 [Kibdelosporangium aridum]
MGPAGATTNAFRSAEGVELGGGWAVDSALFSHQRAMARTTSTRTAAAAAVDERVRLTTAI